MRKKYLKLTLLLSCFAGTIQAQTWTENDKIVSANREANGNFSTGYGVSICGDYAVAGAPNEDYSGYSGAGRAYVYKKGASCEWVLTQVMNPPSPGASELFGFSVAIDDDYMVIASRSDDHDANDANPLNAAGSAYIYKNISGTWTLQQKIVASDREEGAGFGCDVDISGTRVVVGAHGEDQSPGLSAAADAGAAYVFDFNGTNWTETQILTTSDRTADDFFGVSVAVYSNYIIAGAPREDHDVNGLNPVTNSGAAYIFENSGGTWSEVQKITSTDRDVTETFGWDVDINGTYAIVGCSGDDHDANGANVLTSAGSAYIFQRDNSATWVVDQKLAASDRASADYFGSSVAITKSYAVVGAFREDEDASGANSITDAGSAYIFELSSSGWSQMQKLVASDRGSGDLMGAAVAIWDDMAIVGAFREDEDDATPPGNTISNAGSAYIFEVNTPAYTPTVTASSTSVCGGSTTLYANGSLVDADNWQWYAGSCNSTPIGTGSSITVSPTSTTTYYVNGVGSCVSAGPCGSITITASSSWHQTTENTLNEDVNNAVITDEDNNVYIAGTFFDQTVLNGGNNPDIVISNTVGYQSASYVAKYDECGNLLWEAHTIESKDNNANSIVLDENQGVVYISGEYVSNLTFQSSNGCVSSVSAYYGTSTGYVAAFDMNTGCATSVDDVFINAYTTASALAINESNGDLFVGGATSTNTSGTPYTSYVFKYAPTAAGIGSVAATISSNNSGVYNNEVNDMDFDEVNHLLWIIGDFEEEVTFSPGTGTLSASAGASQDAYLLAYEVGTTSFGTVFNQIGNSSNYMSGEGVAVDPSTGNPFMTGTYREEIGDPFDFGVLNGLPSLTGFSAYCATYNLSGSGWARYYDVIDSDAHGIDVAHDGELAYFTGTFNRDDVVVQTLGSYPYAVVGTPQTSNHTIVVCFKNDGNGYWVNVTKDPGSNTAVHEPQAIAANTSGHVFVAGQYEEKMDYYYSTGAPILSSTGSGANGFILRAEKGDGNLYKTGDSEGTPVEIAKTSAQYTVYPNPTNSALTLQIEAYDSETTYKGMLMNATGQVVRSETITASTTVLDLSGYPAGIYFLVISDGTQSQTVRISKTN